MDRNKLALAAVGGLSIGLIASPAVSYAATYFSTTTVVTGTGSAYCPSGSRITGGGAELPRDQNGSTSSTTYKLEASRPSSSGWSATASKTWGTYSSTSGWRFSTTSHNPRVYAICAR